MINVTIKTNPIRWHQSTAQKGSVCGTALVGGIQVREEALLEHLPGTKCSNEKWSNMLASLNGFFSFVHCSDDEVIAAVDPIRSIPLFYGKADGQLYIGDDADWVRRKVGDNEMDPVAREEFQLAGYVTGRDTLFPNIKQLQAGEFLVATETGGAVEVTCHRYYRFTHTEPEHYDEPALRQELDDCAVRCIQRLIDYAGDRQIVIPLSGGYDSRLIATLLKRLGYDNILAFTYGAPGNKESEFSRKVAESLNIPWRFVEYSKDTWRRAWQTGERINYQRWASGWASLPHMQDWLAVRELKDHRVDPDCVFVPGHGAMAILSHLSNLESAEYDENEIIQKLWRKKFDLAPSKDNYAHAVKVKVTDIVQEIIENGSPDIWSAISCFEWQERQSKFLANSVRTYEFFGYDWWMPLWDQEFMSYWTKTPLVMRRDKGWYVEYVKDRFGIHAQIKSLGNAAHSSLFKKKIKRLLSTMGTTVYYMIWLKHHRHYVRNHIMHPHSRFSSKLVNQLSKKGYGVNGIEAYMFLNEFDGARSEENGDAV